jgi:hypothetical protein
MNVEETALGRRENRMNVRETPQDVRAKPRERLGAFPRRSGAILGRSCAIHGRSCAIHRGSCASVGSTVRTPRTLPPTDGGALPSPRRLVRSPRTPARSTGGRGAGRGGLPASARARRSSRGRCRRGPHQRETPDAPLKARRAFSLVPDPVRACCSGSPGRSRGGSRRRPRTHRRRDRCRCGRPSRAART